MALFFRNDQRIEILVNMFTQLCGRVYEECKDEGICVGSCQTGLSSWSNQLTS